MMKKMMPLCCALLLGSLLPAQDSGRAMIAAARKRAAEARGLKGGERRKILEDALALVSQVPERFPSDTPSVARAWLESGRLERRLGREQKGREALAKVLEHPSEKRRCCDALHEIATSLRRVGQRKEAAAALSRLVAEFPDQARSRARALVRLGGVRRELKDVAGARSAYEQCLKEHGDQWRSAVDSLNGLVNLAVKEKDLPLARKTLKEKGEAIRSRFAGTRYERSSQRAFDKMSCLRQLKRAEEKGRARGEKEGGSKG